MRSPAVSTACSSKRYVPSLSYLQPIPVDRHTSLCRGVSTHLKGRNVRTRSVLGEEVAASYYQLGFEVAVFYLDTIENVRDLLTLFMFAVPSMTRLQSFRVCRDPTDGGMKMMQVQHRSYEDRWGTMGR